MEDDDSDLEGGKNIPFISLENVHKTYLLGIEGIAALRGVDIQINQGEFVMICGTSGGGKSTMLNIMGTIDKPTKGRVTVCGKIITPRTSDDELAKIRLENLGFVFQTFNLLGSMTALENVELPLTFLGYNSSKRKEIAKSLLQSVQMGERLQHYPTMLSGGEQQRVTIARAMANSPGLLLLDEPTGDLDTLNTNNVMRLLINLNKKGITLVMVTHDMNLVQYGTRVVLMRDGKVSGSRVNSPEDREAKIQELEKQIALGRDGRKDGDFLSRRLSSSISAPPSSSSSSSSSSSLTPTPNLNGTPSAESTTGRRTGAGPGTAPVCGDAARDGAPVVPVCSSVREPGDYDPVFFSDSSLTQEGYEISVGDNSTVIPVRPFYANPYSNLRKEKRNANGNNNNNYTSRGENGRKDKKKREESYLEYSDSESEDSHNSSNGSKNSSSGTIANSPMVFMAVDPNAPPPPASSTLPPLLSTTPTSTTAGSPSPAQARAGAGAGKGEDGDDLEDEDVGSGSKYSHVTFDAKYSQYTDSSGDSRGSSSGGGGGKRKEDLEVEYDD